MVVNPAHSNDDWWAAAIRAFTGFPLPARADIFDKLVGNDKIPLMSVKIDKLKSEPSTHIDDVVNNLWWRTLNSGHEIEVYDIVVPFFAPQDKNDRTANPAEGTWLDLYGATIRLLGDGNYTGWAGNAPGGHVHQGGESGEYSTIDLADYSYGGGRAMEWLLWGYDTNGFSFNNRRVPISDAVDLNSFDRAADAITRAAVYFDNQSKVLANWEKRLGEEDAAWKGQAAGVFYDLVHKLNKLYEDYAEDLPRVGTFGSKQGQQIKDARTALYNAINDLHTKWVWWSDYLSNPLRWLHDNLLDLTKHMWNNNAIKTRFAYEKPGEGADNGYGEYLVGYYQGEGKTHRVAEAGFSTVHPDFGHYADMSTWKKIGEKAIEEWQKGVEDNLGKAAKDAILDVRKAFSVTIAPVKEHSSNSTLAADWKEDKAEKKADDLEKKAKDDADKAKKDQDDYKAWMEQYTKDQNDLQDKKDKEAKAYQDQKDKEAKAYADQKDKEAKAYQEQKDKEAKAYQDQRDKELKAEQDKRDKEMEEKEKEAEAKAEAKEKEQEAKQAALEAEQDRKEKEAEAKADAKEKEAEAKQAELEAKQEAKEKEQEAKQAEAEAKAEAKQAEQEAKQEQKEKEQEAKQAEAEARQQQTIAAQQRAQEQRDKEQERKQAEQEAKQEAKQAELEAKQEQKEKEAEAKQAEQEAKQEQKEREAEAKAEAKEKEQEAKQIQTEAEYERKQAEQEAKQEAKEKEQEEKQAQAEAKAEQKQAEQEAKQEQKEKEQEEKQEQLQREQEQRQNELEAKQEQKEKEAEARQERLQAQQDERQQDLMDQQDQRQRDQDQRQQDLMEQQEQREREAQARYDRQLDSMLPQDGNDFVPGDVVGSGGRSLPDADTSRITLNPDGSLQTDFSDGSSTVVDPRDNSFVSTLPDGSTDVQILDPGDTVRNPDGSWTTLNPDGTITTDYPDGSSSVVNPDDGTSTVTLPDGHTETTPLSPGSQLPDYVNNGGYRDSYPSFEEELHDDLAYDPTEFSRQTPGVENLEEQLLPGQQGTGAAANANGQSPMGPMLPPGTTMTGASSRGSNDGERVRTVIGDSQPVVTTRGTTRRNGGRTSDNIGVPQQSPTSSSPPFMPPMGGAGGGAGGQQGQTESSDRERASWLAEDEDVWGTDEGGAPAVIGR